MNTFVSLLALVALAAAATATAPVVDERIDGTWCVNYNFTFTNKGYSVKIVTQGANVTILNPTYPDPNFSGAFTTGSGNTRAGAAAVGWAPIYLGSSPCGKVVSTLVIADANTIYGVNTAIPTEPAKYQCIGWGGSGFMLSRGACK